MESANSEDKMAKEVKRSELKAKDEISRLRAELLQETSAVALARKSELSAGGASAASVSDAPSQASESRVPGIQALGDGGRPPAQSPALANGVNGGGVPGNQAPSQGSRSDCATATVAFGEGAVR